MGLKQQTLPFKDWELIIIDNASSSAVKDNFDISWHPNGRTVLEEKLGLTNARLRGIIEARGELLVFVDDDNILNNDFLEITIRIANEHPFIGTFGGNLIGEFEIDPPIWFNKYLNYLAIRKVDRTIWTNNYDKNITPAGAGLIIRDKIAFKYLENAQLNPKRRELGRKGNSLISCEDIDLSFTAIDMGYGIGIFKELILRHLIPKERLQLNYILKLYEANIISTYLLDDLRGNSFNLPNDSYFLILIKKIYKRIFWPSIEYQFSKARYNAYSIIKSLKKGI